MYRKVLLLGFVGATSAFMAPATLPTTRATPALRAPATAIKMADADMVLATLPGFAAIGVQLQQSWAAAKPPPTDDQMLALARINFKSWNDALQTKDPATVANLYSTSDLSFLPTVSPEHIKDLDNTEDYFTAFVQKHPFGTITDDSVTVFDDGEAYLHSGMYTFELGEGDARAPVEARFSYVWRKSGDGEYKITHHHSSVRPEAPAPTKAEAPAKEPEVKKEAPKVEKKEPVAVASKAVIEEDKEEVQELKAKYTETAQKLQTETLRRIEHEKQLKEVIAELDELNKALSSQQEEEKVKEKSGGLFGMFKK